MALTEPTDWPVPGLKYTIQERDPESGRYDSLSHIASKAYGNGTRPFWKKIWKANKHIARKRKVVDPSTGAVSYIKDPNFSFWPGDVIWIPGDPPVEEVKEELREDVAEDLTDVGDDEITIIVKGQRVPVISARILTTFDTAADGFTAVVPWNPDNETQRELFKPYSYHPAEAYVGGKLKIRGTLYTVAPQVRPNERIITLKGWSLTADIVDSTIKAPFEQQNVTLEQRARELIDGMAIGLDFRLDDDPKFDRVTADKTDKILDHLGELCNQRGAQLSSTNQGRLLIHTAASGAPVASIREGAPPFMEISAEFDGRTRFNSYTAYSQTPEDNSKTGVANDDTVPKQRFVAFSANELPSGELQKAADWLRSKQLGESMVLSVPTHSWYRDAARTELWEVNTIVTVVSPSLFLDEGFEFLIRQVEFILEDEEERGMLELVPPQVYTGEPIPDEIFEDR